MIDKISKLCCGCMLCYNVCPKNAISIYSSNVMNYKPIVNYDKCVSCGLCVKKCPLISTPSIDNPFKQICYGAVSNTDDYSGSSSGGIASTLITFALENNYIVYATIFANKSFEIKQIINEKDAYLAKGSKYVYSNPHSIYKDAIQNSYFNKVIFIGTPCQIYSLKMLLPKKCEDNVVLVDLVCHGTPSFGFFEKYIDYKSIDLNKTKNIIFRNGHSFAISFIDFNNKTIYRKISHLDEYYELFSQGSSFQNGCYSCPFASPIRFSDITLGDYWGASDDHNNSLPKDKRISLILVSTNKGKEIVSKLGDRILKYDANRENIIKNNPQLKGPSKLTKNRLALENYFSNLDCQKNSSFKEALSSTNLNQLMKKRRVRYFLRRLLFWKNKKIL